MTDAYSGFVTLSTGYPYASTPVSSSSGNVANSQAVATLPAAVGQTTYLLGAVISAGGATLALLLTGTIVGAITGTLHFTFGVIAGVLGISPPLILPFSPPLPGSGPNTAIVITLPACGLGNTNATVFAWGYQL